MRLEYYPEEKLKKEIRDIIGRHLDLKKFRVFFFGSRVSGRGTDRSDIDVGIEGRARVPAAQLTAIEEELQEIPTLYTIEVVDFSRVSKKFREVAREQREFLSV